jgi:lipooligosaccharide transport system ATP-binding protein
VAPLVEARALTKRYGDFTAVDGIDVEVEPGEVFGFLGPNGAGKSTTMRMIGCVSQPTSGRLTVLGMDAVTAGRAIRRRLGVVPQQDTFDEDLSVRDNLLVYGRYFGLPRHVIAERSVALLDAALLTDRADAVVRTLSGGMKRRLTISRALINEPDLVLLDEPTTGLDPQARHVVWERLYRLKTQGVTLIITTHYMDEAEQLCDRLVVMDQARIVDSGTPADLIARHTSREVVELRFPLDQQHDGAGKLHGIGDRIEVLPDRVLVSTHDADAVLHEVHRRGVEPLTSLARRSSLEDVFLRLTGRALSE